MKVLCVIDSLGPGGAQRQLVQLAKGFSAKGHSVSFLVYHQIDFYKEELDLAGISVVHIFEPSYLIRLYKMRKHIRSGNYNAVVAFLQASCFICEVSAFPFKNWRLIVGERSANPNIFRSFKLRCYRWFHFFADYVVANSHANIDMVRKLNPHLRDSKLRVIYNIVRNCVFEYPISNLGLQNNKLQIVVGASHRSLKNSKGMVEAINSLHVDQRRRMKVKWYGDSVVAPYVDRSYPDAVRMVKEMGLCDIVEFYPATQNFLDRMSQADIVALFSFYEGLPNVVCEAMAMGKPVMVSRVSDIPFILAHNDRQIFDPNSVESIKNCFEYFLSLSPKEFHNIGSQNREVAKRLFAEKIIVCEYLKLLEK